MAVVNNVEDLLRLAVRERIEGISSDYGDDLTITYHLALDHRLAYEVEPDDEDPDVRVGTLTQTPIWMLNLTFSDGEIFYSFQNAVPYQCCATGQTKPMTDLVDALWERYVLARSLHMAGLLTPEGDTPGDETD